MLAGRDAAKRNKAVVVVKGSAIIARPQISENAL